MLVAGAIISFCWRQRASKPYDGAWRWGRSRHWDIPSVRILTLPPDIEQVRREKSINIIKLTKKNKEMYISIQDHRQDFEVTAQLPDSPRARRLLAGLTGNVPGTAFIWLVIWFVTFNPYLNHFLLRYSFYAWQCAHRYRPAHWIPLISYLICYF